MREVKLIIRIDEKTNKIGVVQETINLPIGIDKELMLLGIYKYLILRQSKKFKVRGMR